MWCATDVLTVGQTDGQMDGQTDGRTEKVTFEVDVAPKNMLHYYNTSHRSDTIYKWHKIDHLQYIFSCLLICLFTSS